MRDPDQTPACAEPDARCGYQHIKARTHAPLNRQLIRGRRHLKSRLDKIQAKKHCEVYRDLHDLSKLLTRVSLPDDHLTPRCNTWFLWQVVRTLELPISGRDTSGCLHRQIMACFICAFAPVLALGKLSRTMCALDSPSALQWQDSVCTPTSTIPH